MVACDFLLLKDGQGGTQRKQTTPKVTDDSLCNERENTSSAQIPSLSLSLFFALFTLFVASCSQSQSAVLFFPTGFKERKEWPSVLTETRLP